MKTFLSDFVEAFRERYSCNHVLIQLIENWKRALNEKFQIGAPLMDLSKAFDCIPLINKKKRAKSKNRQLRKLFVSFDSLSTPRIYTSFDPLHYSMTC